MNKNEKQINETVANITPKIESGLKKKEWSGIGKGRPKDESCWTTLQCCNCNKTFEIRKKKMEYFTNLGQERRFCGRLCFDNFRNRTKKLNLKKFILDKYTKDKISISKIVKLVHKPKDFVNNILLSFGVEIKDARQTWCPEIGTKFHDLSFQEQFYETVYCPVAKTNKRRICYWVMLCVCGKRITRKKNKILNGQKSCGCLKSDSLFLGEKQSAINQLMKRYRSHSKDREFSLTREEFIDITSPNCFYCGKPPSAIQKAYTKRGGEYIYNGIDRIDSGKGYIRKNSISCCSDCNSAKLDLSQVAFFELVKKIYEKHSLNKENASLELVKI